jgi:tetratricopeptide (TPR) repeat protein
MQTNSAGVQTSSDLLKLSVAHQQQGRFASMLEAARRASELAPDDPVARIHEVDCLQFAGETRLALQCLQQIESDHANHAQFLFRAGETYVRFNRSADYHRCCARAFELAPDDPEIRLGLARALIARGDATGAEALLAEATKSKPHDGDAWFELARLRRWTAAENHIASIERAVASSPHPRSKAAGCYALFKELDDLGEASRAMSWLQIGARTLRSSFSYRVEVDEAMLAAIARGFPGERLRDATATGAGRGAIFVVGLPRSGTTLVERIFSAHPQVESLGECRDLAFAVARSRSMTGAGPDHAALGRSYLTAVDTYRTGRPYFVDKAPMNFLSCGMIRLALPGARIVMLRRHPLDSCLAIYRTYFREHLAFAHDLEELGRYYVAWHRLVEHWRQSLPDTLLAMSYESLVTDPEIETRRLLAHCGLDWDPR